MQDKLTQEDIIKAAKHLKDNAFTGEYIYLPVPEEILIKRIKEYLDTELDTELEDI